MAILFDSDRLSLSTGCCIFSGTQKCKIEIILSFNLAGNLCFFHILLGLCLASFFDTDTKFFVLLKKLDLLLDRCVDFG